MPVRGRTLSYEPAQDTFESAAVPVLDGRENCWKLGRVEVNLCSIEHVTKPFDLSIGDREAQSSGSSGGGFRIAGLMKELMKGPMKQVMSPYTDFRYTVNRIRNLLNRV